MDAKKTAQQVLEQVGGAENVTFLTHCVTRRGSTSSQWTAWTRPRSKPYPAWWVS